MSESKAWIGIENGTVLEGRSVGAAGEAMGDLVFNTAMSGYQEILTDPSYCGQVVIMTYPLIGNYGVVEEDSESDRGWAEGFIMKEMASVHSNHRATDSLGSWLEKQGIVAIDGIDTRRLTKITREEGSLRCVISTTDSDPESLVKKARAAASTDGRDLASVVTCKKAYEWKEGYDESYPSELEVQGGERFRCVAIDLGAKRNILRSLHHCGFDTTVVPSTSTAEEILSHKPHALFLSNGPGDPAAVTTAITAVTELVGKLPIFGICLGHQILSIVLGAKTQKMPFGHHGANHPVRDITTGRIEITAQNHSFAVVLDTLPKDLELTHLNLNDQTVEGMRHRTLPIMSVQYHPEAAPGPLDSSHLFRRFYDLVAAELQQSS
ncbi:MAG: carbamoyl-phosphate synthase small subunit [Planctomycetota bacterium]|jgi:carbamoyl-phosphate synthase small subunit